MKQSKHITREVVNTVLWVNTLFKGKVTFCGSFGLVLNGKLDRPIHDIDCITDVDYYGKSGYDEIFQYGVCSSGSEKFYVEGVLVKVFKIYSPSGMGIDVMFRADGVKSEKRFFEYAEIKVERPESAIHIKENYLKILGSDPNPESYKKHSSDLNFITGL